MAQSDVIAVLVDRLSVAINNLLDRIRKLEARDQPWLQENLSANGGFETWPLGNGPFTGVNTPITPTWSLVHPGLSVISVSRVASDDVGSAYAARIAYAHAGFATNYARLQQRLDRAPASFMGRTIGISARVKFVATARVYVSFDGGTTRTYGDPNLIKSDWDTITLTTLIPDTATSVTIGVEVTDADGNADIDSIVVVEGVGAVDYRVTPTLKDPLHEGYLEQVEISTPVAPDANHLLIYTKDLAGVSTPYWKGDDGVEYQFASSSGVVTGFVPYIGATGDVNLGAHDLLARNIYGTDATAMYIQAHTGATGAFLQFQGGDSNVTNGAGGGVYFIGGTNTAGTPGNANGGDIQFDAGQAYGSGTAGNVIVNAAYNNNSGGAGGYITFQGGYGTGADGGSIYFQAGYSSGGTKGGDIYFSPGSGTGGAANGTFQIQTQSPGIAKLQTPLLFVDQTFDFPNQSGTFALLSDIPVVTGYVPYTGATSDVDLGVHTLTSPTIIGGTAVGSTLTLKSTTATGTTDAIIFQVGDNGATEAFRALHSGFTAFGTTTNTNARVRVVNTTSETSGVYGIYSLQTLTQAAGGSGFTIAVRAESTISNASGSNTNSIGVAGVYGIAISSGAGNVSNAEGIRGVAQNTGAGTISAATSVYGGTHVNNGGGIITRSQAFYCDTMNTGSTNNYAAYLEAPQLVAGIGNTTDSVTLNVNGTGTNPMSDQTATTTNIFGIRINAPTYTSTTNVRTGTNVAGLYIVNAPIASTNVTFVNGPYAIWSDAGNNRLDGDTMIGSHTSLTPISTLSVASTTGAVVTIGRNDSSVTANDVIGGINFRAIDTSSVTNQIVAQIEVQATNTVTTDINPGRMIFRTTPTTVAGTPLERFRLDEQGSAIYSYRVQEIQGADVASTNNLVLGGDGNTFEITGTTQINLLANTNWQNGSIVTLLFTSTPVVKHNQTASGANLPILLSGAADWTPEAGARSTLVLSEIGGTQAWREVARVNPVYVYVSFPMAGDGTNVMTTGVKVPKAVGVPVGTLVEARLVTSDVAGNITVDIKRATYSAFPTFTSMVGGSGTKPNIANAAVSQKYSDTTFTSWTSTAIAEGDMLQAEITAVATLTEAVLILKIRRG